jgi:hypothetical protein
MEAYNNSRQVLSDFIMIVNSHLGMNEPTQIKSKSIDLNIIKKRASMVKNVEQVTGAQINITSNLCDMVGVECNNIIFTQQVI